jgi:hypothetical protein
MVSARSGLADQETFGAAHQHHAAAGGSIAHARGTQAFATASSSVNKGRPASPVESSIDRPGHAGGHGQAHVLGHAGGVRRKAVLKIRVDGQVHCRHHLVQMGQRHVAGDAVVGRAVRPREAGAGGGQRLEAQALQVARAARVPGVGDHEAAGLMQRGEGAALVGDVGAHAGAPGGVAIVSEHFQFNSNL